MALHHKMCPKLLHKNHRTSSTYPKLPAAVCARLWSSFQWRMSRGECSESVTKNGRNSTCRQRPSALQTNIITVTFYFLSCRHKLIKTLVLYGEIFTIKNCVYMLLVPTELNNCTTFSATYLYSTVYTSSPRLLLVTFV